MLIADKSKGRIQSLDVKIYLAAKTTRDALRAFNKTRSNSRVLEEGREEKRGKLVVSQEMEL